MGRVEHSCLVWNLEDAVQPEARGETSKCQRTVIRQMHDVCRHGLDNDRTATHGLVLMCQKSWRQKCQNSNTQEVGRVRIIEVGG